MAQKVTIVSEKSHQTGQKHRSSNNFTTADFNKDASLTYRAYYHYGTSPKEATNIVFTVKADRTGADATVYEKIKSGTAVKNTHHRNLYIADPEGAAESFTIEVSV